VKKIRRVEKCTTTLLFSFVMRIIVGTINEIGGINVGTINN